jgi:hypothetical protein
MDAECGVQAVAAALVKLQRSRAQALMHELQVQQQAQVHEEFA